MSLWTRIANVFRGTSVSRELDEELASHLAEAVEQGRDASEARKAFGSQLQRREQSYDLRVVPWLDSLRSDAIFGWRQLRKRKMSSAAAIVSLGVAIGACAAAFRLIDALLLRPLPVKEPQQLFVLTRSGIGFDGKPTTYDAFAYPAFRLLRDAVKDQAELLAISFTEQMDVTYGSDQEIEKAFLQFVSGSMFPSFGLRPAAGRLLTPNDDLKPGAHPYAVLSHDYWARRFGQDPNVVGRTLRVGDSLYTIAGVSEAPFTGTETGTVTDIFLPTMMQTGVDRDDWTWLRIIARVKPGLDPEPIRAQLHAVNRAFEAERAKGFKGMTKETIEKILDQKLILLPAASGVSGLQTTYRKALLALAVLVALVLLIACANVANLMTAQAAARAREMALRVSIGAGRWRLVQLVLVESAWLGLLASIAGALLAWWAAPFVAGHINPPDNPARLALPADFRVLAFGIALAFLVTFLFGLAPAFRASAVKPAGALKGGEAPHARRRLMHALIALQVAFCFLVIFAGGLFVTTFKQLANHPNGFEDTRLLALETISGDLPPAASWDQTADHLRGLPGVETVAQAGWPLLSGWGWNGFVSVNNAPPGPILAFFLATSPGWLDTMKIRLIDGRDFLPADTSPGTAIVNETFARQFFPGQNPLGQLIAKGSLQYRIAGVAADVPYQDIHEPVPPQVYVPLHRSIPGGGSTATLRRETFLVRTATANPLALAAMLRREISQARPDFRVTNVRTQHQLVEAQTIRERLLALLALFFAAVALILAGVGLYGVLDYTVLQRRREIGIRIAIGAPAVNVARTVTADALYMVLAGSAAGLALGLVAVRPIASLLYEVNAADPGFLLLPAVTILAAAFLAALPAIVRAVRIDPVETLRGD